MALYKKLQAPFKAKQNKKAEQIYSATAFDMSML